MTTQETIDRAAFTMAQTGERTTLMWGPLDLDADTYRALAQALADAGLLADPSSDSQVATLESGRRIRAEAALIEARATNARLNRRAQQAESALDETLNHPNRAPNRTVNAYGERIRRLEATIQRVRDLHQSSPPDCTDPHHDGRLCPCGGVVCESCGDDYPCATIRALDDQEDS